MIFKTFHQVRVKISNKMWTRAATHLRNSMSHFTKICLKQVVFKGYILWQLGFRSALHDVCVMNPEIDPTGQLKVSCHCVNQIHI